jgi:Zn-dependent protease/CBS domain-containing protein
MGWSFRIARVAGIDVRVHATFFLILVFYGWIYYSAGGPANAAYGIVFVLLLFLCVLLHEFGHAFAARAFGIRTPDITLLPIGGVARLERMPRNPWQELAIAVAGPAVNIVIALLLAPIVFGAPNDWDLLDFDRPGGALPGKLLAINVLLVAFNMIPAFPMDGGRVLRALLALFTRHTTATLVAARVGQTIAVLFAIAGLMGNPFLILIAVFVFMGAQQELVVSRYLEGVGGRTVRDVMITNFDTLPLGATAPELAAFLAARGQSVFPVVQPDMRVVGLAARDELLELLRLPQPDPWRAIRSVPLLPPGLPAANALHTMQACGEPILPVVNASAQIVGLVSSASLARSKS